MLLYLALVVSGCNLLLPVFMSSIFKMQNAKKWFLRRKFPVFLTSGAMLVLQKDALYLKLGTVSTRGWGGGGILT